jgi:threonylcarbamoyladenosine tRNA methylthiotransferase MtaB
MRRRHLRADIVAFADTVRALRPDAVLGADLIAGFPTETETMFANSLRLIDDAGLTHLHVFPYSVRPGTPAAKMPQVPGAAIKERAARLREAGRQAFARRLAGFVGTVADVLIERPGYGHSAHYVPVDVSGTSDAGSILRARIVAADTDRLRADPLP